MVVSILQKNLKTTSSGTVLYINEQSLNALNRMELWKAEPNLNGDSSFNVGLLKIAKKILG